MRLTLRPLLGFFSRLSPTLPPQSIAIVALLLSVNLLVWVVAAIILRFHPMLVSPAALAYSLGLRHALDADHISAIDLMTRRLVSLGQRPSTVGTFFSLGHSTIVIVTCVVVAATSGALRERFDGFTRVGNIIGTSISAAVLLILCLGNIYILVSLIKNLRSELARAHLESSHHGHATTSTDQCSLQEDSSPPAGTTGGGIMMRLLHFLFKSVDRPWKMYPLGVVFGLGFDTSSEIAILGISSLQALQGTSLWLILVFPVLFTSAMCLLDTLDGASMLALYTSQAFSRDPIALLYYQIILSAITVLVSAFIGIIQLLSLVQNVADPQGPVWDGVSAIGDHFDIIGGSICGLFLLVGVLSMLLYLPWRRRMDRRHRGSGLVAGEGEDSERAEDCEGLASPLGEPDAAEPVVVAKGNKI
ncbi:hypothetical protein E4U09_006797 [Claviceps aff. purpurea]|uniref:Nickel/cobalt efflux system n=1 Tax=Claviceps aff. purpurea TaxID=1967640 RepID=A0A9P7U3T1_9HYPO|nr:hypothetical protein E4U09_006797 [Claviceps aff. purpurea]